MIFKRYHVKSKHKRAGRAFLILDKIDCKTKKLQETAKFHDGKRIIYQKDISTIYIHTTINKTPICTNQK